MKCFVDITFFKDYLFNKNFWQDFWQENIITGPPISTFIFQKKSNHLQ